MSNAIRNSILLTVLMTGMATAENEISDKQLEFFESKIRPVLVQHCYECHSADSDEIKGGLVVDTREGLRRGGDSGEAVVPGDVEESLLLSAMNYESYEMPPAGPLPEAVLRDFRRWVRMGAPDPRDGRAVEVRPEIDVEQGRQFWSFQPIQYPTPPGAADVDWPLNEIDQFVLAKLEEAGLQPVDDASRTKWLRRVSFDLTGLPPTPDEIQAFLSDDSADAYEKVVDRLLNSEQYGERWGRHWLDVARYAETMGKTRNFPLTFAWRYRDYVIDSFNRDTPYDQFVREQLAGDLMRAENEEERTNQLIATGFLAIGSHDLNEGNVRQYKMDVIGEQIDVVSRSLMGLTVGCARCHDHKFDPIPTADYYALAGLFQSTRILNGYVNKRQNPDYFVERAFHALPGNTHQLSEDAEPSTEGPGAAKLRRQLNKLKRQRNLIQNNGEFSRAERAEQLAEVNRRQKQIQKRLRQVNQRGRKPPSGLYAMGVRDAETITDCKINLRGDPTKLGGRVPRGFLQVASMQPPPEIPDESSGRLELAEWLVSGEHPLTARVIVNRVWQHMFGTGLVRTVDNFGAMGERPSHPQLLDYLASRFMQEGWSIKRLVRTLALSHTYRLGDDYDAGNANIDGDNRLLWRANRRRLDVESLRDAIMTVSGQLLERPEQSPVAELPVSQNGRNRGFPSNIDPSYRSVYLPVIRNGINDFFTVFDFPDPSEVRGRRDVTTVPTQALFMLNDPFITEQARLAAERLVLRVQDPHERVHFAYRQTLSRAPTQEEVANTIAFAKSNQDEPVSAGHDLTPRAWAEVYHALFACAEFRYR